MSSVNSVAPIHPVNTIITPGAINVTTTASVVTSTVAAGNGSTDPSVSHIHPIRTYITPQSGSEAASNKEVSNGGSASGLASATASSGAASSGRAATADSTSAPSNSKSDAASSASPASSAPANANGATSLAVAGTVVMVGFAALLFKSLQHVNYAD